MDLKEPEQHTQTPTHWHLVYRRPASAPDPMKDDARCTPVLDTGVGVAAWCPQLGCAGPGVPPGGAAAFWSMTTVFVHPSKSYPSGGS